MARDQTYDPNRGSASHCGADPSLVQWQGPFRVEKDPIGHAMEPAAGHAVGEWLVVAGSIRPDWAL
jgi:hypothetical protein